ncbi:MAG TPA: right-handed parallel beta-helix repeat-containing protein [Acidimicrobiia bacterium]
MAGALMTSMALAGAGAFAGTAGATAPTNLWVAKTGPYAGNGKSCAKPGFSSVQAALNAAAGSSTVHVCAGTYSEQLTITKPVSLKASGAVTLQLPASPADSTTPCEVATPSDPHYQDEVDVCTSGSVTLIGFTVHADWPAGTCNDDLNAVLVAGGATLRMTNDSVTAAGAVPLNGCQGGIGIEVGMAWTTPVQVGHAVMNTVSVSGYQKNGITVDGSGSTATINKATVTGIGATNAIAQNGIQISNGAKGTITKSTISGNECDDTAGGCGPDSLTNVQSVGVLLYAQAAGSGISGSTLSNNDIGVYVLDDPSAPAPTKSTANIATSTFTNNRYEGVILDQGLTTLRRLNISGSTAALQMLQYDGQTYGARGTANFLTITGATYSLQIRSDDSPSDKPGSITLSNSSFGGGVYDNQNPSAFSARENNDTL